MKTKEEYLDGIMSCTCDEMYKSRKMTDPQCAFCNYGEDILEIMEVYRGQFSESPSGGTLEAVEDTLNALSTSGGLTEKDSANWLSDEFEGEAPDRYSKEVVIQLLHHYFIEATKAVQKERERLFLQQTGKPSVDTLRVQQNADYQKLKAALEKCYVVAMHNGSRSSDERLNRIAEIIGQSLTP